MDERPRSETPPGAAAPGAPLDWRTELLAEVVYAAPTGTTDGDAYGDTAVANRLGWPGYDGAVAVRRATGRVASVDVTVAVWDFSVYGGSFGERDADAFLAAAADAVARRRPLVSFLRSGGTRLQEGVAGLVGLPRVTLALRTLAEAGVPHLAVVDHPTTGGVWVTLGSRADLRVAVAGATVGFAGPRVVEAVTGVAVPADSHTAAAAGEAGLVDAVLDATAVRGWLARALRTLDTGLGQGRTGTDPAGSPYSGASDFGTSGFGSSVTEPPEADHPEPEPPRPQRPSTATPGSARSGWEQVAVARHGGRPAAGELLDILVADGVDLVGKDRSVRVRLGHLTSAPAANVSVCDGSSDEVEVEVAVVAVAVSAWRGGTPGPEGYRLVVRAARLAGRLGLPLVTLVDTPGADPAPAAEAAGVAAAIGDAMDAVLGCAAPTVCVVVGEGGSGGAIAVACTDVLLATADSYVAALSPEGVAATLRTTVSHAADGAGLRPVDLLRLGVIDGVIESEPDGAVPATDNLVRAVGQAVQTQMARNPTARTTARNARWSTATTGRL